MTTSTLSTSAANSTVCVFFSHPLVTRNISVNVYVRFLVCLARIWSACLPRLVFPAVGSVDSAHAESPASSVQCPKVRQPRYLCILPIFSLFFDTKILTLPPFAESCPKATSMTQRKSSERFHNTKKRAFSSSASTSSPSSTIYTGIFVLSSSSTASAALSLTYTSPFLLCACGVN